MAESNLLNNLKWDSNVAFESYEIKWNNKRELFMVHDLKIGEMSLKLGSRLKKQGWQFIIGAALTEVSP